MDPEEIFSEDHEENMRIEIELMKLKLKAQYGDAFQMESNEEMPVEMENQFLKNILAFEETCNTGDVTTIYDRIGKPAYSPAAQLDEQGIKEGLKKLLQRLQQHLINLDFSDGPYDDATVYRFITEELFHKEIDKEPVEGMTTGFIYEEFHPNHKKEIERNAHQFFREWFTRDFKDNALVLSRDIITAAGLQMERNQLLDKLRLFFDAFKNFGDDSYTIDDISFELQPGNPGGLGFAEGLLKYDAEIENREMIHFEGPYKLYMQMEQNVWSVFYFVLPGFKW